MQKSGMAFTAVCECGAKEQTAEHVLTSCPICHHPNAVRALLDVGKNLLTWVMETCPAFSGTFSSRSSPPNEEEDVWIGDDVVIVVIVMKDCDFYVSE